MLGRKIALLWVLIACFGMEASAADERVTIAVPGPLNIPFLPLDLAGRIGADRAEGLELILRHTSGGAGLKDLQMRNVDFAVPGVPAAMSARAHGHDVVVVAAINDLPVYVLAARSHLKGIVKRPRDLAGRIVGVTSSTLAAKTTSHQVAELLLRGDGMEPSQMRLTAIGQNWEEVQAAVRGGFVDAFVLFEPFPSRLIDAGLVYPILSLGDAEGGAGIPGAGFLLAGLVTRREVIERFPDKVGKVVAMLRRTLAWIAAHSTDEIVAALKIDDDDKQAALRKALRRYPRLYSPDARFSARQIAETERFFSATQEGGAAPVNLDRMVESRWAGVKP